MLREEGVTIWNQPFSSVTWLSGFIPILSHQARSAKPAFSCALSLANSIFGKFAPHNFRFWRLSEANRPSRARWSRNRGRALGGGQPRTAHFFSASTLTFTLRKVFIG